MLRERAGAWLQALGFDDFNVLGGGLFLAALVFLASFLAILYLANHTRTSRQSNSQAQQDFCSDAGIVFQFAGQKCTAMTPSAQSFLGTKADSDPWSGLITKFDNRDLEAALIDLSRSGLSFRQILSIDNRLHYLVEGMPSNGLCEVTFLDITQSHSEVLQLRADLAATKSELSQVTKVLGEVPALSWVENSNREVTWRNAAYAALCETNDLGTVAQTCRFRGEDLRRINPGKSERVAVEDQSQCKHWYNVTKTYLDEDQTLFVALDASKVVDAEETLHRFICTLTETFAHIPIGLAIFDADRSLSMFNPALSELLAIDPAWLAARPDFTGFLERLREQRKMPEARDFVSWREKVNSIADAAAQGEFCEDWSLPGGMTLRVTGSPHPKGAVALLFEDISIAKSLEQKFRSQIELSQTILATLSEGVAVFDTAGMLVFSNQSFDTIWGFSPTNLTSNPTIHDLRAAFETRTQAQTLFDKARDFVTHTGQRTNWRAQFDTNDGKTILGQFAPLPDGSSLMAFLDVTKGGATLGEITSAYSKLVVDRQNERDLVGLSLEHLKSYISRQDRVEGREVRAAIGDKLSMLEGLLWGASAASDPSVAGDLGMGNLSTAIASGQSRGLDIDVEDTALIQEVFDVAGIGPTFLNSLLILVGALVATGGTATLKGQLNDDAAGIAVLYTAAHAPDLEERRFSLVVSLMRELAQKHDVGLTFEPGATEGSIEAMFSLPLSANALLRVQGHAG